MVTAIWSCQIIFISDYLWLHDPRIQFPLDHSNDPILSSVCVCVCTIWIDVNLCKTSIICRGVWHSCPTTRNEAVGMSGMGNVAGFLCLHFLICCIVRPLGAYKSQLGGPISYRCWFLPSMSTLILYILHIYIYILLYSHLFISKLFVFCTSSALHIKICNDKFWQVCAARKPWYHEMRCGDSTCAVPSLVRRAAARWNLAPAERQGKRDQWWHRVQQCESSWRKPIQSISR